MTASSNNLTRRNEIELKYSLQRKLSILVREIAIHYNLYAFLSPSKKYEFDYNLLMGDTLYYYYYQRGMDREGRVLQRGSDYIPESFEEWMRTNFRDLYRCIELYSLSNISIKKEYLEEANELYKKYKN